VVAEEFVLGDIRMNKLTVGIASAAVAAVGAVAVKDAVYVDSDGGGVVTSYVSYYDQMQANNTPIIIRGGCNSSCTMALGYKNVCLMPNAVLGFHPAYTPILFGLFSYLINYPANAVMLSHYPPDARKVIDAHGDLTRNPGGWFYPKLFYVKGNEFPPHYLCKGA
jgi:hypothetical protein